MTLSLKNIFCVIGILIFISACVPGMDTIGTSPDPVSISGGTPTASGDANVPVDTSLSDDASIPNDTNVGDPATIGSSTTVGNPAYEPLPELDSGGTLSYSVDASGSVPTVGSVESESYSSGQQVAMSAGTIVSMLNDFTLPHRGGKLGEALMGVAHAETSTDICAQSGVTCCPIEDDLTFECYLPVTDMSVSQVSIAIVGTDGALGDVHTETVHDNLKWLANAPTDVTVAGSDVYSVTNGLAVKTTLDATSGDFLVSGDHEDSNGAYRLFDVDGTVIAYDGSSQYFAVMNTTTGISVMDSSGDVIVTRTILGATGYTEVKSTIHDTMYFGVVANSNFGIIYNYIIDVRNPYNNFKFINTGETDSFGNILTHARTLAFDVSEDGYALVVYEDQSGNYRIRAVYESTRFGGEIPISTATENHDFKDLQFVDDSLALLLDATTDTVWPITMNTTSHTVTSTLENGISVGAHPQKIVLNSDKSRAYVLNANDDSVTTISLHNSDGSVRTSPQVVATTRFADLVPGASLTFSPVSMTLAGDSLFVACANTKSLLQINLSSILESTIEDEDNDGDGYTGSEGDCDDTDATLNPITMWYQDGDTDGYGLSSATELACEQPTGYVSNDSDCDDGDANTYTGASELCDGVDNDCDETIDEDVTTVSWYPDADGDGFGSDSATATQSCSQPAATVRNNTDCDDAVSTINSNQSEVCDDRVDNNCDGLADENCDGGLDSWSM